MKVGVENVGKDTAKNVRVELKLPKGFSGESKAYLGEIERSEEKFAEFELEVAKNVSGSYEVEVDMLSDEGMWIENLTLFVFPLKPIHIE